MSKVLRFKCAMLCALCASLFGCGGAPDGPRMYPINGIVTFQGAPLKEGEVLVRTDDGKFSAGARVADGKFVLSAPAGPSKVEISAMRDVPGEFREENPGERVPVRQQFIPAKYNTESTLKLDVKPDSREAKFELEP